VLVKDLARRGFVRRTRDPRDERRLALVLTRRGAERVAADSVLDPERLAGALAALDAAERRALVAAPEHLAEAARPCPPHPRAAGAALGRPVAFRR
jgi:DNA-binding MarR family transcriptional regulator